MRGGHAKGWVPADGRIMRESIAKGEARIRADDMQPAIVIGHDQHGQFGGVYAEITTLRRRLPTPFGHADDVCVECYRFAHPLRL